MIAVSLSHFVIVADLECLGRVRFRASNPSSSGLSNRSVGSGPARDTCVLQQNTLLKSPLKGINGYLRGKGCVYIVQ